MAINPKLFDRQVTVHIESGGKGALPRPSQDVVGTFQGCCVIGQCIQVIYLNNGRLRYADFKNVKFNKENAER